MSIYVISDNHFGHFNIIKYTNRPFENVEEMDNYMISQWNKTVTNEDTIIHCGDFAFGDSEAIMNYTKQLNGKKILVMGNHDRKGVGFFASCGFEAHKHPFTLAIVKNNIISKYVFSHAPLKDGMIPEDMINIHGHIHNTVLKDEFSKEKHICVSVECVDYTPMRLD